MDFEYKKAGTIYNMHSYWTKQPIDPIKYFIEKYSDEGDTILDPFCGTGMTGVAALQTGRNVILNDLSPLCLHISKGYCTNFHVQKDIFTLIAELNGVLKDLDDYYTTKCTNCGEDVQSRFSIVGEVWQSKDGKTIENRGKLMLENKSGVEFKKEFIFKEFKLLKICYLCHCQKDKQYKDPDTKDLGKFYNQNYLKYFIPEDDFFGQEPKRNYKRGIKKVYQLYSNRNLTVLSIIYDRIKKIKDENIKQLFSFIFTSILFNSSLMSRYRGYENTSIKMGTFYIPPLIKDTNVLENFRNKFELITKGNAEIFMKPNGFKAKFLMESADELESIKNNSIDYIYTDPPYSDILSYSELNIVYESWLGVKTTNDKEMIVSKYQKKDIEDYSSRFEKFLKRSLSVLKEGKYLTLVFHHPNLEHWHYLQRAINNSGFEPIITDKPIRLISNSKTASQHNTQKNSQCFLIFNLRKNSSFTPSKLKKLSDEEYLNYLSILRSDGIKEGYIENSDLFDFLINKILFKAEIKEDYNLI